MNIENQFKCKKINLPWKVADDEDEQTITAGALTTLVININRTSMADLINHDTSSSTSKGQIEQLNSLEGDVDADETETGYENLRIKKKDSKKNMSYLKEVLNLKRSKNKQVEHS